MNIFFEKNLQSLWRRWSNKDIHSLQCLCSLGLIT
uniref:Uncharacterized protein n=1 Tax=Brassica campestris TaxID=3711 RepID=A0A3P5YZ80_BRACM|nr:unnamed protein product [Brassica rapa]